jgi:glyoxylase-like metal-dependent hydrolase (beta-lactamase superfamily II)
MLRIVRVLAPNPSVYTLEGTNTWIVGDDPCLVIDPGPDDPGHHDEVRRAAGGAIAAVLLTHDHEDHGEGARTFAALAGAPLRAWRLAGAEQIRDGARAEVPGATLIAVHTPGHSADHVAFFEPTERALFTGDAVVGRGTSFIDPPDGDLAAYLASLHTMLELHPRTIYPGHGPVVPDAPAKLHEYLAHRAEREEQVLGGLAAGDRRVAELVARIYEGYPPEVHALAARSVTAHLQKLQREGRAQASGRGASQTWTAVAPAACERCGRPVRGRGRYCPSCSLALLQGDTTDAPAAP